MANQQEQLMAEFVQWLPQNIAKFEGQIPEEIINPIANAQSPEEVVGVLNQLSQSEQGNQLVTGMFQAFQQSKAGMFKKGGKLNYLINKFQNGGYVASGKVVINNKLLPKEVTIPIAKVKSNGGINLSEKAQQHTIRIPSVRNIHDRNVGGAVGNNGWQGLFASESVNGNTAETSLIVPAPGDTLVRQKVYTSSGPDYRTYKPGSYEYRSVVDRLGEKGLPGMWSALRQVRQIVKPAE